MKIQFILNDPPYGTERGYNALRLANALAKKDTAIAVTVFLMADAVSDAKKGQKTPDGLLQHRAHAETFCSGTHRFCSAAPAWMRAGLPTPRCEGARRSTMDELAAGDKRGRQGSGVLNDGEGIVEHVLRLQRKYAHR